MAVQTKYPSNLVKGFPGQVINTEVNNIISATVVDAPIAFGLAATRGASDRTAKLGGTVFFGISVRDRAVEGTSVDAFPVNATGGFLTKGPILVVAGAAVTAGAAAGFNPATGALVPAVNGTAIPNAEFDTAAAAGELVVLRIR